MKKDHILAEINRTALANGGIPLGKERFYAETGIKESDWHGKYWVRWGDAHKEAGFQPNKLNSAYEDGHLLGKLAIFIRELGHFPVAGELRIKARQDNTFPSHNTFARFGGKQNLIARLVKYCQGVGDLDDIVKIAESVATINVPDTKESPDLIDFGFVYLLKSGRHYKIGRSNAVGRRERELAIQLPERAEVVHSIKTDDPAGIEAYWHKRFEKKRKNGEWFELNSDDISAFKRRKFM